MLQRHAFEAWAEIDIQLTPATLPTLDPKSNGPTTRQPSPSNKKKDPASVHNQIKMKPPPAETLVVYPDGSYHRADQRRTGCGFVIVSGGDGDDNLHASEVARGWKPLPKGSNNTAELFAGIEALKWILKVDRHRKRPILICFDLSYAEGTALGHITPKKILRLAQHLRQLWMKVLKERAGQAWARHVAGHSGHKWNDLADELANKGARGSSGTLTAALAPDRAPPLAANILCQAPVPRTARPIANTTTVEPTRPERDLSSELDEEAPPNHDQGRLYTYAQACSYPLFFGLDSTSRTERSASISMKLTEEKRAILWASKNLRTVSDLLLASGTALRTTLSDLLSGIRQNALNEVIAGLPLSITNALEKAALAGISVNDPACRLHPLRLQEGEWIMWQEQPARILCIYSGVAGGGTACGQTHHFNHKTGRLFPLLTKTVPLVSLPACQPISIRCAVWDGGTDEPSELAATSLNTAPCYLNQLCIKHAPTTWLRKATHLHVLSVKKNKEALTTRQWQPPRTMAPEGCLFGALFPNSSSTASLASQIRRVFTATKLPSLPATFRELWYRVLVSVWFCYGKAQIKGGCPFLWPLRTHLPHKKRPPLRRYHQRATALSTLARGHCHARMGSRTYSTGSGSGIHPIGISV